MVLPEYQRMGLAKKLTKHCNDIQDQYKANRYVSARFTSMNMFRGLGFKDIGVYDPHAERWGKGYDVEKAKYALLCRASQLTV